MPGKLRPSEFITHEESKWCSGIEKNHEVLSENHNLLLIFVCSLMVEVGEMAGIEFRGKKMKLKLLGKNSTCEVHCDGGGNEWKH